MKLPDNKNMTTIPSRFIVLLVLMCTSMTGIIINAQESSCSTAPIPRLNVGEQAQVTPGLPNNVRNGAGVFHQRIGQIPAGSVFEVLDGPVCAGYYYWWKVEYRGLVGWTSEGVLHDYWLQPVITANEPILLSLRVDPVLRNDAGTLILEPETFANIMISSTPNTTTQAKFYFTADNATSTILIGSDVNIQDGATLVWWVESYTSGYLTAKLFDENSQLVGETDSLYIASDHPTTSEIHTHSTLGFEMNVLPGWAVEFTQTSMVVSQGTLHVDITTNAPTGLPAGNRITFTSITHVMNIDLRRDNLIYENQTKAAYYTYQGLDAIPMAGLNLYIIVSDDQPDYNAINISEDMLLSIDQMIATLQSQST